MIGRIGLAALTALTLAGCERENPQLFHLRSTDRTPDEFAILPTKPLETPSDLTALPQPNPGGVSRTDPAPLADAIAALGGNASGGVGADAALVAAVSRYGVQAGIRDQLASEDLDFRRKRDGLLLERVFNVNVYFKAYRAQSLDQHAELERLRAAGIRTVAAPPEAE